MSAGHTSNYLTPEQVYLLNEKYGWFEFGDAQSDKSRAFAQDAIATHERIRAAAQDLLSALCELLDAGENCVTAEDDVAAMLRFGAANEAARAAIAKAVQS